MSDAQTKTSYTEVTNSDSKSKVEKYATEALVNLKATDYQRSKSAQEIYNEFKQMYPSVEIADTTFRQMISILCKDEQSKITRLEGKYGYFLSSGSVIGDEASESDGTDDDSHETHVKDVLTTKQLKREYLLYPILEKWLSDQNYKVVSGVYDKRSNETWGNPDVAGIHVEEYLGQFDLEITSIEAKSSNEGWGNKWRKDIFEAVSHKRYANRVYFAFAARLNHKIAELREMKYYCELYRIGLIVIQMPEELHKLFGDIDSEKFRSAESLVEIKELVPAPYDKVSLAYQRSFCEKTFKIFSISNLFDAGKYKIEDHLLSAGEDET